MKYLKNFWKSIKESIVLPLDECVCGELYPDKYFQNGGKCHKCNFQMYQPKQKTK